MSSVPVETRPRRRLLCCSALAAASLLACAPRAPLPHDGERRPAEAVQVASFDQAWERIGETYPHRDMNGVDWDAAREALRPRAARARSASEVRPVIRELLARLGESHFDVLPGHAFRRLERLTGTAPGAPPDAAGPGPEAPRVRAGAREAEPAERGDSETSEPASGAGPDDAGVPASPPGRPGDPGFSVVLLDGERGPEVVVSRVDPEGPAAAAGVRPGWSVESIGTVVTRELVRSTREAVSDEALAAFQARVLLSSLLSGGAGTPVRLEMRDAQDETRELELLRRESPGVMFGFGNLPAVRTELEARVLENSRVGYVRFSSFLPPVALPFTRAVNDFIREDVQGIVIDLRGNPGGLLAMVVGMAGHFIDRGDVSLGTMTMRDAELRVVVNPRPPSQRYDGPVAVLVDGFSASTSEIFAAGMQEIGRARVFGTRTAGMALPSVIEVLPNGDRLQFATADMHAPSGQRIEGRGVYPDEPITLTRKAILREGDPVLAAAVTWIEAGGPTPVIEGFETF